MLFRSQTLNSQLRSDEKNTNQLVRFEVDSVKESKVIYAVVKAQKNDEPINDIYKLNNYVPIMLAPQIAANGTVQIVTSNLKRAIVNVAYLDTLKAQSLAPVTWKLFDGEIPEDLELNPTTGEISGTSNDEPRDYNFTVVAFNDLGSDTANIKLTLLPIAMYYLTIPETAGIRISPRAGRYDLRSDQEIVIDIAPSEGYSIHNMVLRANGNEVESKPSGFYGKQYNLGYLSEDVVVTIDGVEGTSTGIEDIENGLKIQVVSEGILVNGLIPGEVLTLCDISGKVLYSDRPNESTKLIPLRAKGAYILTAGNRTEKVIF